MTWQYDMVLALAEQDAQRELKARELRAVRIASGFGAVRDSKGRWSVQSDSDSATCYRVRNDCCNCPDECANCKHVIATWYTTLFAAELARRMHSGDKWRSDMDELQNWCGRYERLLDAAEAYAPPDAQTLLTAFALECIGDDAFYRPVQRMSDLRPVRPWVARIIGLCPRYEFCREFMPGHKDYRDANKRGSRGVYLYFQLPPGLYEYQEIVGYGKAERRFAVVENLTLRRVGGKEVLECLVGNHVAS